MNFDSVKHSEMKKRNKHIFKKKAYRRAKNVNFFFVQMKYLELILDNIFGFLLFVFLSMKTKKKISPIKKFDRVKKYFFPNMYKFT